MDLKRAYDLITWAGMIYHAIGRGTKFKITSEEGSMKMECDGGFGVLWGYKNGVHSCKDLDQDEFSKDLLKMTAEALFGAPTNSVARQRLAAPRWTRELPKVDGLYWYLEEGIDEVPAVVEWDASMNWIYSLGSHIPRGKDMRTKITGRFWSEPLTYPDMPTDEEEDQP